MLADVELVLVDADILHETIRDGVGDVAPVKFCDAMNSNQFCETDARGHAHGLTQAEKPESEERHDDEIQPV